jgi:hypothetical protein
MKLSAFSLFLILLFVLVISIWLGNSRFFQEGFVSFMETTSQNNGVSLPCYSTKNIINKLYDSLYFDPINGNLIEVNGTAYTNKVDTTGNTISSIYVTDRIGNTEFYNISGDTPNDTSQSQVSSIKPSTKEYTYVTQNPYTDTYYIYYMPCDTSTYLHIIDAKSKTNIGAYYYANTLTPIMVDYTNSANSSLTCALPSGTFVGKDSSDNLTYVDSKYDPSNNVYQLTKYVKYDPKRGFLIFYNNDGSVNMIYDSTKSSSTVLTSTLSAITTLPNISNFSAWTLPDTVGNTMIFYGGFMTQRVINVIYLNSNGQYVSYNSIIFNSSGVYKGSTTVTATRPISFPPNDDNKQTESSMKNAEGTGSSDYWKWYWYFNTYGGKDAGSMSDKYMLKTQLIPPVFPGYTDGVWGTPYSGAGTLYMNEKGQMVASTGKNNVMSFDASGNPIYSVNIDGKNLSSLDKNGNVISTANPNTLGGVVTLGQMSLVGGAENVVNKVADTGSNIISKTEDLAKSAGSGAVDLAKSTGSGAMNLANKVGTGIYDAGAGVSNMASNVGKGIYNAGAGAAGLAKDTVSGAVGLAKDTVSGAAGFVKDSNRGPTDVNQKEKMGYGGINSGHNERSAYYNSYNGPSHDKGDYSKASAYSTSAGNDIYSYYGALPTKGGSNFMPLTASFSAFGK